VLRAHYLGRASKAAALEFFGIWPKGAKAARTAHLKTVRESVA